MLAWWMLQALAGIMAGVALGCLAVWCLASWQWYQAALMQDYTGAPTNSYRLAGSSLRLSRFVISLAHAFRLLGQYKVQSNQVNATSSYGVSWGGLLVILFAWLLIPYGPDICWSDVPTAGTSCIRLHPIRDNSGLLLISIIILLPAFAPPLLGYISKETLAWQNGLRLLKRGLYLKMPLALSLFSASVVFSTFELNTFVEQQGRYFMHLIPLWGVVLQPLGCIVFILSSMTDHRQPPYLEWDGGIEPTRYMTGLYGTQQGLFILSDYFMILLISAVGVTVFFGGWQIPFLVDLNAEHQLLESGQTAVGHGIWLPGQAQPVWISKFLALGLRVLSFALKLAVMSWFQLLIRWSLPSLTNTQISSFSKTHLLPLASLNLVASTLVLWSMK